MSGTVTRAARLMRRGAAFIVCTGIGFVAQGLWARTGGAPQSIVAPASSLATRPRDLRGSLTRADLSALADTVVVYDLLGTQPAEIAPPESVVAVAPAAIQVRPPIQLRGVIGNGANGNSWTALVDGAPGRPGTVSLTAGDTTAGMRVLRVTATTIVFRYRDSTWTESLQTVWR